MGFIARLKRRDKIINLNASLYTLSADFSPPSIVEEPRIAEGQDNRGGRRTGEIVRTQVITVLFHTEGSTVEHIRASIDNLNRYLRTAGNASFPTTFEWKPDNDVSFEPIWGQLGAFRKMTVLWGHAEYGEEYGWWDHSHVVPDCKLTMLVDAHIEGNNTRAATANGGIFMDYLGVADGNARGVMIPEATTNKMTNPVFGHATYDNGWTTTGAIASKNTDKEFILWGKASMKITRPTTAVNATQSITPGATTHTLTAYVKMQDGSAVGSSQAALIFANTLQTTTYIGLGNGWYQLVYTGTGSAGASGYGVRVGGSAVTIYIAGVQLEEKAYPTPLAYGDLLGCAWTGTAHASTSTRTAAKFVTSLPSDLRAEGSICVVWYPHMANTDYTADGDIFGYGSNLRAWFDFTNDRISFTDNTNTVNSSAITFSAYTPIVLHFVWEAGSLKIYKDGAQIGTGSTYTPPSTISYIHVGNNNGAAHLNGTFGGFTPYPQAMSATEVLNQYNNISAAVSAGRRVEWLTGFWTRDANDKLENADNATYQNWGLVFDLPGTAPAGVVDQCSMTFSASYGPSVYLASLDFDYQDYDDLDFLTALGSPDAITVTTADIDLLAATLTSAQIDIMSGRTFYGLVRGEDDGANNISIRAEYNPGAYAYYSEYAPASFKNTGTDTSHDATPGITTYPDIYAFQVLRSTKAAGFGVTAKRATGSAVFNVNSIQFLPEPMLRINVNDTSETAHLLYVNGVVYKVQASSQSLAEQLTAVGNPIKFIPGRFTALLNVIGGEAQTVTLANDAIIHYLWLTPRWSVL